MNRLYDRDDVWFQLRRKAAAPGVGGGIRALAICLALTSWLTPGPAAAQTAATPKATPTTPVVLGPRGCIPKEITVKSGLVDLQIVNRTGYRNIHFQVSPVTPAGGPSPTVATLLADVTTLAWESYHLEAVALTPGQYQLSIYGDKRWACSIVVK
jgi:hypothetical protein